MELREKMPQCVVGDYNWSVMPLGGFVSLGIPAFYPGHPQPMFRIKLNIPGVPRLIHRRKDSMFPFNRAIDHYAVVFATGANGWALPDDWVFEIRAGSNHEHTPFRYREFDKGDGPVSFHRVKADSKDRVIRRLEEFFRKPKKYAAIDYNCEAFAREIMTGVPECTQIDDAKEMAKFIVDSAGPILEQLVQMAEAERQRVAALEEAKRKAALTAQAPMSAATAPVAQQLGPTPPVALPRPMPKKAPTTGAKKPKIRRKPYC